MKTLKRFSSALLLVTLLLSFSLVCFADMPVFGEAPSSATTLEEVVTPSEDIPQTDTPSSDSPTEELPPTEDTEATPVEYIPIDYRVPLYDIHERLQSIEQSTQIFIYGVIPIFSAVIIVYKLLGAFKDYFRP